MQVDLILQPSWIIPVEPETVIHKDFSLVIHHGRILDILPNIEVASKYQADHIEILSNHVLIPGLVNCHTHAAMTLFSGLADDLPLMDWLENHIWPAEQKWVDQVFVRHGTDLAIAEMLRGGTTCFNDMYFFPEIAAEQAVKAGIRANIGLIVFDFATVWAENADTYLAKGLALHKQLKQHSLISTSFAPHAPYTVSDEPLKHIQRYAGELDISITMHVHETAFEVSSQRQQTGQTPLQRLKALGLLSKRFLAVHMTQLTAEEIADFAQTGAHIVHCPESNLKLASGICPISQCLDAGINVAIGTDGSASNNDLDMFGEIRSAALLAKGFSGRADTVPAMQALKMATINGAKALGLENEIGSLQIGKAADVVAVDLNTLESRALYNPASQLVYSCSRQQVSDVWVAGKRLLKNRQLTTLNQQALMDNLFAWQDRIIRG